VQYTRCFRILANKLCSESHFKHRLLFLIDWKVFVGSDKNLYVSSLILNFLMIYSVESLMHLTIVEGVQNVLIALCYCLSDGEIDKSILTR